ncbi:hypothetical protein GCM10027074_54850 [Streptomyces deserti]
MMPTAPTMTRVPISGDRAIIRVLLIARVCTRGRPDRRAVQAQRAHVVVGIAEGVVHLAADDIGGQHAADH